jgi:hypothetical protein
MDWIDINARQPQDGQLVLTYEGGKPDCGPPNVGEYTVKLLRWGYTCGGVAWPEPCYPTHWFPVPDVPNAEGQFSAELR